jgi:hypothetical protein
LAFHVAHKKIPHVDLKTAAQVKPTKPNGIELELFVFGVSLSPSISLFWRWSGKKHSAL